MALKFFDKYGPRATAPTVDYPQGGSVKNESVPGANDGTPLDKDQRDDLLGWDEALFAETGITMNNLPDTAIFSQRLQAHKWLIARKTFVVFDSVSDMISNTELFEENNVITLSNGFLLVWRISSIDDPAKYTVLVSGGLYAELISSNVEMLGLGLSDGDDISQTMDALSLADNVRAIRSSGADMFVMSTVNTWTRNNCIIELPTIQWVGDYDLYGGGASDRQIGIITVTGSRDTLTPLSINAPITDGDSTFSVSATTGLVEGGFAVMIGGAKYNYLTRIVKIDGLNVTLDYTAGWDELAGVVDLYAATPVEHVHVFIKKIIDLSGATVDVNQATGVTFLDSFGGSLRIDDAEAMANPLCLTRRAHSLDVPYMDNRNPRYVDSGRGYTIQFNGSLFCKAGTLKGTNIRHTVDWTRCAFCHVDDVFATTSAQIAITTHGAYEHDIDIDRVHTSKGCVGTMTLANSGAQFGERTKRFRVNERLVINGNFDIQNSEDVELYGVRVIESSFVRINADVNLNNCDFEACTSFRIRSRPDRDQLSVTIDGGKYPDIELQNFSGTIRCGNAVMGWFVNQDVLTVPSRIKTDNCRHNISNPTLLTVTNEVSLASPVITVPATSPSIGVIVESKKLHITTASCENSPVISHDGMLAKVMTINGIDDVDPNAARTAAVLRSRGSDGLQVNISAVTAEYSGSGNMVEFDRADVSNLQLVMNGNTLNGDIKVTGFGSVVKSIITSNFVKDLTDLPAPDANNAVANNIQL